MIFCWQKYVRWSWESETEVLQMKSKMPERSTPRPSMRKEKSFKKTYRPVRHSRMIRPSFSYPLNSLYLISQRFNHSWYKIVVLYQNVQKYVLIKAKILWLMIGVTFSWYQSENANIWTLWKSKCLTKAGFPPNLWGLKICLLQWSSSFMFQLYIEPKKLILIIIIIEISC